ncbi:MAG TPA: shikimate dehydrogenase [Hanamia sp.]|nr:shikimate dehydrogenase [Hanamia sp.]
MKIYGLIGRSLGHSFSEKYFAEKFKKENIRDCQYFNFELKDLGNEIPELKKKPDLAGLNVTIPYKTEILPFLDEISTEVSEINACNCIKIKDGKWKGYNTDIIGFEKSFVPHLKPFHKKALVLGTGGASKAVVFVLKKLGIDFLKVSRNKSEAKGIISYEDLSEEMMKEFQIMINTTPLGTFPNINESPELPYGEITNQHYFFDLIYNPSKTQFLSLAEKKGAVIENGSQMLMLQAEESWKIWNENG